MYTATFKMSIFFLPVKTEKRVKKEKKREEKKKGKKKTKDESYNRECQLQINPYSVCCFSREWRAQVFIRRVLFYLSVTLNGKDVC